LVLLDRDRQRAHAVGVTALSEERHRLVDHVRLDRDGLLLERHPPVVVVAERQLVLDQPIAAHRLPAIVAHTLMLAAMPVSPRAKWGIPGPSLATAMGGQLWAICQRRGACRQYPAVSRACAGSCWRRSPGAGSTRTRSG